MTIKKMTLDDGSHLQPAGEFAPLEADRRVHAERKATGAVGHGKKAAKRLRGDRTEPAPKHAPATFEHLNPWYYSDAPQTERPQLDIARRTSSFDEVQGDTVRWTPVTPTICCSEFSDVKPTAASTL